LKSTVIEGTDIKIICPVEVKKQEAMQEQDGDLQVKRVLKGNNKGAIWR
jgi:hypothetical protein